MSDKNELINMSAGYVNGHLGFAIIMMGAESMNEEVRAPPCGNNV